LEYPKRNGGCPVERKKGGVVYYVIRWGIVLDSASLHKKTILEGEGIM